MQPLQISLILPCYRPAPGWVARLSERYVAFCAEVRPHVVRLTVVHDGTPGGLDPSDIDALRLVTPRLTFLNLARNRGKGFALRQGVAASQADLYVYTDIDLPYTTASMVAVVDRICTRGGVVAGERFDDYYATVPPFRRLLSRAHRYAMRKLFRLPVGDSQAGLKGFDESGKAVFLETTVDRFLVDLDFISRCRGRVDVRAVRVQLRPDVVFTDFGIGILRTEAGNFLRILRASWLRL